MTIERKITMGLEDILAIAFECTACLSRLSVSPERFGEMPTKCPRCSQEWYLLDPAQYQPTASPFVNLTTSIKRLREVARKKEIPVGFNVLLEFDGTKL
jgi:hypothetical protein